MPAPEPVTPEEREFYVRTPSCPDLELTLVKFFHRIFDIPYRLDNPTRNLMQPDVVPFDPEQRAEMLEGKVPPRIEQGRIPRTVTGEIDSTKLPDVPAIIVQAIAARIALNDSQTEKLVTARILVSIYDEDPKSHGYQDALNITEAIELALTSFGQQGIDKRYVINLPLNWQLAEQDTFPHFVSEMTTQWWLPAGRAMPDWNQTVVPVESHSMFLKFDAERFKTLATLLWTQPD